MQGSPPPDLSPDAVFLEQTYDTDVNWAWRNEYKEQWGVATDEWQQFYEHWRDSSTSSKFLNTFPYFLELGADEQVSPPLFFLVHHASGDRVLVTKSYNNIFHRLLRLRQHDSGEKRGAVLTGQAGTGKTLFLTFMLVKLISAGQVVLLYNPPEVYLFYHGQVYSRLAKDGFESLPKHRRMTYCPIWALIDGDYGSQGLPIGLSPVTWPVYASSPSPTRWTPLLEQNGATLLGMPLWNMEELLQGFCLHPEYNEFRSRLGKLLRLLDAPTTPITNESPMGAALEVLRKSGQSQALMDNVEDALEILVHNAIEEFGFIPRDVYDGIFRFQDTKGRHTHGLWGFQPAHLQEIVQSFWHDCGPSFAALHCMAVVFPRQSTYPLNSDDWAIDFKSIRIARRATELMQLQTIERLREVYGFLHRSPEGSSFAGWVFEAIVHRMFSDGQGSGPTPQPVRMVSDGYDPPVFSADPSSSTSLSPFRPPHARTRAVTQVNFADRQLSDVTLDDGKYYKPTAAAHPLFDSFTIDMDLHTVVISVFRITISQTHEGSAEGYTHIHKIIRRVRKLLEEAGSSATVKVEYFLVCPDDGSQYQWRMPAGWNEDAEIHDHRGDGFCIRVPVPEHHGMSWLGIGSH